MKSPLSHLSALVIDDNRDAADSLARLLSVVLGCEARFITDPTSALLAIEEDRPDVVFLDIGMPDIDGYELARQIRVKYPKESIQLVAVTGHSSDDDRTRSHFVGFDAHLMKPASPDLIERTLSLLFLAPR